MTELEYIDATNLTKLRLGARILGDCLYVEGHTEHKRYMVTMRKLHAMILAEEKRLPPCEEEPDERGDGNKAPEHANTTPE